MSVLSLFDDEEEQIDGSLIITNEFRTVNSNETVEVQMYNEDESPSLGTETSVKISREGMRRKRKTSALVSDSYRQRKTDDQVKILADLYRKHKGRLDLNARKEAMAKTGLAWIQIYKWFFDREHRRKPVKLPCCCEGPSQIFRVIGKDGREIGGPTPIFKVDKVTKGKR